MNIDYSIIVFTIAIEEFLLGCLWSTTMVRKVITQTDRPLIVVICAVLGSLAILYTITFIPYVNILTSLVSAGIFSAFGLLNTCLDYYFVSGPVLHEIINVFLELVFMMTSYLVFITLPIYLGAALGVKLATTRPVSWLAFFAPMATTLVFLLALVDDAFSRARSIFEVLYSDIINFILGVFGKYVAMAFQIIAPTTVIIALFWLGTIFGAKAETIKPMFFAVFLAVIAIGLLFFLYGQPFYIVNALFYIGMTLIFSGPLRSLY